MAQKLEAKGSTNVDSKYNWDDGSDHDGVSKIYVRGGSKGIQYIKFDYVKGGQVIDGPFHGYSDQGFTQVFEINHLEGEHLVLVEAYYSLYTEGIQSLQFRTNLRISEFMGYQYYDQKFTLGVDGKKIIGFHGSARPSLSTLGAYVTLITPTKTEANGGKGGKEWDDGANYEAVTKILAHAGHKGIENIQFEYVDTDGHLKRGPIHGNPHPKGGFPLTPFEINHVDKEYLLSIEGYYNETTGVIQALQFKSNMQISELMGYTEDATKFSLGCNGKKIIGFHGYTDKKYLSSLGAYIVPLPLTKLEYTDCVKGSLSNVGGSIWDDGTFHGVRKVYVYYDNYYVRCVRFEYDNNGKVESRDHGSKADFVVHEGEFVLDYPNEFITSVEGTIKDSGSLITSLTFKTSKMRTSITFGNAFDSWLLEFKLEREGCVLVGFHGKSDFGVLHALGAYFFPVPLPHNDEEEPEAQDDDDDE